jgi:c-di-GMP-binding flagellar brake protein YcgR
MSQVDRLIETFDNLNERKRSEPNSLSAAEKNRWRLMRCQIEEALFQRPRDPAKDTREFIRVPISLRVRYAVGGEHYDSFLTVLGEGGLFLASSNPAKMHTKLNLEINPIGIGPPFTVRGEVVWIGQDPVSGEMGMGIRFLELSPLQQRMIHVLVDDTIRQNLLERRNFSRIDTRIDVSVRIGAANIQSKTHDLCLGGFFIAHEKEVELGEIVEYSLDIPAGLATLKGEAEVIHMTEKLSLDKHLGLGLKFLKPDSAASHSIQNYIIRRVTGKLQHAQDEPRQHARLKRRFKIRFQAVNSFGTTDVRDISGGGLFMQTREPPPEGSRIELTLINPVSLKTLPLSADVVRTVTSNPKFTNQMPGIGVAFVDMTDIKQKQLDAFIENIITIDKSTGPKFR